MKTAEEIYGEMKAVFESESDYKIADDCDMGVRMRAFASQAEALYIYGQWVTRQFFPKTAEGEFLDRHGETRGLERKKAEKAQGEIRFSVSDARDRAIVIPKGTVCINITGTGFVTTEEGRIPVGEKLCTVKAEAVLAGALGNAAPRTIVYMTNAPTGVEACVNMTGFAGGRDIESDEEFRERIQESYKMPSNGANAAWYRKKALGISGVAAVGVVSCPRGAGSVDVYIASETGVPDESLINRVQAVFDEEREICTDVSVLAPTLVNLNVEAEVKIKAGYNATEVIENVKAKLYAFIDKISLGRKLYLTELGECIHHTDGVESYRIISPDYDWTSDGNVLLSAGEINIGRWN